MGSHQRYRNLIIHIVHIVCTITLTQAWNAVLTQAALGGTAERISKFCRVLSHRNTCLDQEVRYMYIHNCIMYCSLLSFQALNALLEVLITNSQSSTAMDIICVHFQFVPSVIPSMTVLSKLCELLLQNTQHQDLYTIMDKLLQFKVAVCH